MPAAATAHNDEETARLFIAVVPPAEVRAALAQAREAFVAAGAPGLRWVAPEGIHLTLKFLGETALARREEIEAAMAETGAVRPPHSVHLSSYGLFGGRRPRVLWAGLDGEVDELSACAAQLDQALGARGFELEKRSLSPHLTLARAPSGAGQREEAALRGALERVPAPPALELPVTALQLIRSRLRPEGAVYETLTISDLQGRRAKLVE